ncbi:hypothetical protein [Micromonospora sp. NPDC007230]|uniref:glutamine amidotransferase-related protein n=1 Tax=Micromonospora sp. NPDC007230 TaxID=3364237 RepID=UPI00369107C5
MTSPARLALVGDHLLDAAEQAPVARAVAGLGPDVEATWIPTTRVDESLAGFDGVWLTASPYQSETGITAAAGIARRAGIPLLGTCGGMQLAVTEFATEVAGLAEEEVLVPLSCSVGGDECVVSATKGSLFARALGAERTTERYHCSYGLNPATTQRLTEHGLRFTGFDEDQVVRVAELPGHPFFLGTLFQPELADGAEAHPIIRAWAAAAAARRRG